MWHIIMLAFLCVCPFPPTPCYNITSMNVLTRIIVLCDIYCTDTFEISHLEVAPSPSSPPSPLATWWLTMLVTVRCLLPPGGCPAHASHPYLPYAANFELLLSVFDVDHKPVGGIIPEKLSAGWMSEAGAERVFMDPADGLQTDFEAAAGCASYVSSHCAL